MKKSIIVSMASVSLFAIALLFVPNGCNDRIKSTVSYTVNDPVYVPFLEFRATKAVNAPQAMVNPGKICLYGNYLFVNEISKGIHVIDNSNPADPTPVAFIELLGNIDITVSNNILYADSFIDLVCFDISNPAKPIESGRAEDVFPNVLPATGNVYPIKEADFTKGVIVDWEVKTITVEEEFRYYYHCPSCKFLEFADRHSWSSLGTAYNTTPSPTSVTGSMSRFAVYNNYLYVVNNNMLKVFSLVGNSVLKGHEQYLSWNVETVFPYDHKLFLGTTTGLLIYDLANPAVPAYRSSLTHVMGCDPVVVQGNYAYVTIRGGNFCGQKLSLLDVIDISNPSAPTLKASFSMDEPYGLGIDGNTLFVCDQGLAIYDATNPVLAGSKLIKRFSSIHGFDVIPYNGVLILIGNDGLYQYDYSDIQNIKQLSALQIKK